MKDSERSHLETVRDRFTQTVGQFAQFVGSRRMEEAERLAAMATSDFPQAARALAMDLACGPASFARVFARRVARVIGVDFTPAMLGEARRVAADARLANVEFICADGYALPFADARIDLALCTYAFHHLIEPARVLREMARVLRAGGRIAVVDVILPEGADSDLHNRIERIRDPSHATTLSAADLHGLFREAGLRVLAAEHQVRERDFDDWMHVGGWESGSEAYSEARRWMEASEAGDAAGFRPRLDPASGALHMIQTVLSIVAEKI